MLEVLVMMDGNIPYIVHVTMIGRRGCMYLKGKFSC
jgi:hypothetical protein